MNGEIAAAVDRLGEAFASGQADQVLSLFVADDEVIYAGSELGELAVGRPALRQLLADLFSRDERYRWRCQQAHTVEAAQGLLVVADATLTVHAVGDDGTGAGESACGSFPYRITGVLEKHQGRWRWRACQGSEPAQPA